LSKSTAQGIKDRVAALIIKYEEKGLPPLTLLEQAIRKVRSDTKPKISIAEVTLLLEACTIDKKQHKKLWHLVTKEEGLWDLYRSIIKRKLRERGLRRAKSTKKLSLTNI